MEIPHSPQRSDSKEKGHLKGQVLRLSRLQWLEGGLSQSFKYHRQVSGWNSGASRRPHPPSPTEETYNQMVPPQGPITYRRVESRNGSHIHLKCGRGKTGGETILEELQH
ncbi:hypothetical protein PO909_027979 [Leuciscus waleckii]